MIAENDFTGERRRAAFLSLGALMLVNVKCTVPIGLVINRTFQFGSVPVRFGVEFHYNVIKPEDVVGSRYNLRFFVIPAAPSALFG
jgi:hypothetical protein